MIFSTLNSEGMRASVLMMGLKYCRNYVFVKAFGAYLFFQCVLAYKPSFAMKTKIQVKIFFLFLMIGVASGCAPSSDSSASPIDSNLPVRPSNAAKILARDILHQDDSRISYCEILEENNSTYSGLRDMQLEPLASLSKMITSAWAFEQLGPDFRFESEIYLNPVDEKLGLYDAYLSTHYDPVVNIEKLLYFISELGQLGVRQLRHLVIDETTRVYLSVLANPHIELDQIPISTSESVKNLELIFNSKNWGRKTEKAREKLLQWAQESHKKIAVPHVFSVTNIASRLSKDIQKENYKIRKVIPSAPLFKYLKNTNVYSNNYLADALFAYLGGFRSFKTFQKNKLNISDKDLRIYTGSGLQDESSGVRVDNLGTCFSMIKILSFFRQKANAAGLNLGQVMLNPTRDLEGTFDSQPIYKDAVVVKTGRLYEVPAMNLAGFAATDKGLISFVFLGHDFGSSDAEQIESYRAEMLGHIFSNFTTQPAFTTLADLDLFL